MKHGWRSVACGVALAVAASVPLSASTAYGDSSSSSSTLDTNTSIGILCVIVGILVYVGWKIDKQDRQRKTEATELLPLVASDNTALGLYLDNQDADAEVTDVSGGLAFRSYF